MFVLVFCLLALFAAGVVGAWVLACLLVIVVECYYYGVFCV